MLHTRTDKNSERSPKQVTCHYLQFTPLFDNRRIWLDIESPWPEDLKLLGDERARYDEKRLRRPPDNVLASMRTRHYAGLRRSDEKTGDREDAMVRARDYKVVNDAGPRSWPTETRCKLRGNIQSSMLITLQWISPRISRREYIAVPRLFCSRDDLGPVRRRSRLLGRTRNGNILLAACVNKFFSFLFVHLLFYSFIRQLKRLRWRRGNSICNLQF